MPATALRTLIRPSRPEDAPALATIYGWHVTHGTGTFELDVPSPDEMSRRRDEVIGRGLPWLVAEVEGRVTGYAYANYFRPRMAYRFALEDSIYLLPDAQGRGLGRLLLAELIARCEARGARQMLAVIGDSANAGSIGLHRALGFVDTGVLRASGWKFDRWLDVVLMQRALGLGDTSAAIDPMTPRRSKTLATWLAVLGGGLGVHRFYLFGARDLAGWAHVPAALLGAWGVQRMLALGQDDQLAWLLIPLLGVALVAGMLAALVYGLTPDERWAERHGPGHSGWLAVLGVLTALIVGSTVLLSTIAFASQRYFEAQGVSGSLSR